MIFPIPKSRQAAGTNFSALGDFRWSMVEISPKDSCSALFQLFKIRFYIFLFQGLFPTPTAVPPAGSAHNMLWALPAGAIFQALDHLYIFRYTLLGKKQPPIPKRPSKKIHSSLRSLAGVGKSNSDGNTLCHPFKRKRDFFF